MSYQQPYQQPGYPQRPQKRHNPVVIGCAAVFGVVVALIVLGVIVSAATKNSNNASSVPPPTVGVTTSGGSSKAPGQPAVAHLGQPATKNGVQLTGLQVLADPPKGALTPDVKGHLWAVKVKVKNLGDKPLAVNPLYFKLVGDDDQEYPLDLAAVDGQIDVSDVAPGLATSGLVAFDIPKGVKPSRIVFTNEIMSDLVTAGLS